MKKHIIVIFVMFLFFSNVCHAQRHGVAVGAGMEYTIAGPMSSYYLNLELNRHEIGVMMQTRFNDVNSDFKTPYNFKGICYQFAFYRERHLYTSIALRGGLVNDQFVVLTPSLVVGCIFNDYVKATVSCGIRGQVPSIGVNMFINLPFKPHEYSNSIHRK